MPSTSQRRANVDVGTEDLNRETRPATRDDATIVERGKRAAAHQVSERPLSLLALSFVVGAGAGSLFGSILFDQYAQRRRSSTWMLEKISESVSNAVAQAIPQSLKR